MGSNATENLFTSYGTLPHPLPTKNHTMSDSLNRYQFHVAMSCSGCSGAIQRVLDKLDGE